MGLFRRSRPLHEQLADEGGLTASLRLPPADPGTAAQPPGWDGEARGEAGIHGVPRARRWDVVTSADAPELQGDKIGFVALPDGTLIVDHDEPDGALTPLAEAIETSVPPPYRAEAVRRESTLWAVAAARIAVVEVPGLAGDHAELVAGPDGDAFAVDGHPVHERPPAFVQAGQAQGAGYVVRAERIDGDFWQVEALPL